MWISYRDSEVNRFHPVCGQALNNALVAIGQNNQYRVLHHQYTGPLEMDFVIQNIQTGKYLCVIEVKRTPSDVQSTRYQFQAMSYVQMNSTESEEPFYILTNLEFAYSFRYDVSRPRVFQQLLQPGLVQIGSFLEDEENVFIEKLTHYFENCLSAYLQNNYEYLRTLEEFADCMERELTRPLNWKSHLAVLLYEYIRGSFSSVGRQQMPDVRLFRNNIQRICREGLNVNFKDIFDYSLDNYAEQININPSLLVDMFELGHQNVSGDSVASVLHSVVSNGHEHEGEVPTDLELARFVSQLAKSICGELDADDLLCDPAAGSGNLISSAIEIFNLCPSQIVANDWNKKLVELLSLRLGLNFANIVSPDNSPKITCENIVDVEPAFFSNVKVIVMNPPFVAGINCIDRKREIYNRISTLLGHESINNIGQMPLEAAFLELVLLLANEGTVVSCVFPKSHLIARGVEAQHIRGLLLNKFGLNMVFNYPGEGLFDSVTKDTCVIVGKVGQPENQIKVFSSYENIQNIDLHSFSQVILSPLENEFTNCMPGIVAKQINRESLLNEINNGWRLLDSEMVMAISFVKTHLELSDKLKKLSDCNLIGKRGVAGNSGGSDLIFLDSRKELFDQFVDRNLVFKAGMRNAKWDSIDVNQGDSSFFDCSANEDGVVDEVIREFTSLTERTGRQQRRTKSPQEWKTILQRESQKSVQENSLLIPRAIRKTGRAFLTNRETFVSTNFLIISLPTREEGQLLASWVSTIFYQLICEVSSKDQEGMRKMEVRDINETYIPDFSQISDFTKEQIAECWETISFLNLNSPEVRTIDRIWAEELFAEEAEDKLQEAKRHLEFLSNKRNPI